MSKRKKVDYPYGFTGTPCIPHPASRIRGFAVRVRVRPPVPIPYPCATLFSALHYGLSVTLRSQHYTTVTTTTVTRIVAFDDARELSTGCGNFAPKKVTTLCVRIPRPNLVY